MEDNNKLISIIIPVYKVEKYLNECISSVVNQTYKNLEIILVDDGSPDKCPEICDDWAKKDSRIRVIHKKNGGLSSARNAGLDMASGDFIGFIDSDDYINDNMYETLLSGFTDKSIGIVSCNVLYDRNGNVTSYINNWIVSKIRTISYKDFPFLLMPGKVNYTVVSKLYRRVLLQDVRFQFGKVNEDALFIYDLSYVLEMLKLNMVEIPYDGYYYRHNPSSISRNINKPLVIDVIQNFDDMSNDAFLKNRVELGRILSQCKNRKLFLFLHETLKNKEYRLYFDEHYHKFKQVPLKEMMKDNHLDLFDSVKMLILRLFPFIYKLRYRF